MDAIGKIEDYLRGVEKQKFLHESLIQDGVMRKLQIIGEAVRKIPVKFRKDYPSIAWKSAADMRSKLVHDYFSIDLNIVWEAVTQDVPQLKEEIKKIITSLK